MREGDEHSPGCSTFFHGNCSVGWTLQQVDPQEREERGNDLNGGKVEQRDQGKERAQEPGKRNCQRPGKMCEKEENQPKSDSKIQRWQEKG